LNESKRFSRGDSKRFSKEEPQIEPETNSYPRFLETCAVQLRFTWIHIPSFSFGTRTRCIFDTDGSLVKIYTSPYWNVAYVFGTTGRVFATCVSRARLFLAISNEIAGGREAALILIQIVSARTIRRYHMSQGRNVAATLVVITSPSASELDRQRHMAKLRSGRSDSADSAPRLATGVAVQPRKVEPPIDYRPLRRTV